MHSRTLVTVDIPEVKTDIETDRKIQNTINDLETALERCDTEKDFLKFNYLSLQLPLTDSLKQLNIKTNKMKIQVRRMKNDL